MRFISIVVLVMAQACGGSLADSEPADGDGDSDVDTDVDGDTDGDSDVDADADEDGAADAFPDADGPLDADLDQDIGPPPDPCAVPTPPGCLRVMTYNIHAARTASIEAIGDAILAADPDIVGLQEVDVETGRSGGVDQIAALAARTGMEGLFGRTIDYDGGQYGIGLLSRFPISSHERLPLPGTGEPRVLLSAVLDISGTPTTVAVTHLGLDDETRRRQVDAILASLSRGGTLALMGDFNYNPASVPHATLTSAGWRDAWSEAGVGDGFTFSASEPRRRIDFIYLGERATSPACIEVPGLSLSDHLPVVATLPSAP